MIADSRWEHKYLRDRVFPKLRHYCQSLGLQFHVVDLYRDIPVDSSNGGAMYELERQGVLRLALEEIKLCQQVSAGPSFVVS